MLSGRPARPPPRRRAGRRGRSRSARRRWSSPSRLSASSTSHRRISGSHWSALVGDACSSDAGRPATVSHGRTARAAVLVDHDVASDAEQPGPQTRDLGVVAGPAPARPAGTSPVRRPAPCSGHGGPHGEPVELRSVRGVRLAHPLLRREGGGARGPSDQWHAAHRLSGRARTARSETCVQRGKFPDLRRRHRSTADTA